MAEPKNETPKTEVKTEVNLDRPISTKELLELLSKMNDNSSNKLAEAIIESRKPYVDPKAEQNEEMFRKQTRAQMAQEREAKRQAQEACPHVMAATLSATATTATA
jgi:hypothetical protein